MGASDTGIGKRKHLKKQIGIEPTTKLRRRKSKLRRREQRKRGTLVGVGDEVEEGEADLVNLRVWMILGRRERRRKRGWRRMLDLHEKRVRPLEEEEEAHRLLEAEDEEGVEAVVAVDGDAKNYEVHRNKDMIFMTKDGFISSVLFGYFSLKMIGLKPLLPLKIYPRD
jgi:hypothetical protein